jgi:integrase
MYSVEVFLARRKPETVKVYRRSLALFSKHVGVPIDNLHDYLNLPKEKLTGDLLTFTDSLKHLHQNSQRNMVASVMSYLSYNDIIVPKAQRTQIVPKKGDVFRDKALSALEVKRVYEFLPPIGKACLLLLFTTGMRIGELIQVKETDMEGKVIHLSGTYTKNGRGRDVVMTQECLAYLTDIWLPQKPEYLKAAQYRNIGLINQAKTPEKKAGIKSLDDDRIIPATKSTMYEILMRGFKNAGFGDKKGEKYLYHPHGLRKSFRSIVGSQNPDLAETLMGHEGYLNQSYLRLDVVKEYEKVEDLLSLTSNAGMNSRLKVLEQEKEALEARLKALEQAQIHSLTALVEDAGREFKSQQVQVAVKAALKALQSLNNQ